GMILADNGAQVLVVEPPGGSPYRKDPGFLMLNRGKSSLELDLKTADGRAQAQGLATKADAVITAWRLGLAYLALREANPRLLYFSISGFGAMERLIHVPGYEHVVSASICKMFLN